MQLLDQMWILKYYLEQELEKTLPIYILNGKSFQLPINQPQGQVSVEERMDILEKTKTEKCILFCSFTVGGVGLNLVQFHVVCFSCLTLKIQMILPDLEWNPHSEHQAEDRMYRLGQEEKCYVYK